MNLPKYTELRRHSEIYCNILRKNRQFDPDRAPSIRSDRTGVWTTVGMANSDEYIITIHPFTYNVIHSTEKKDCSFFFLNSLQSNNILDVKNMDNKIYENLYENQVDCFDPVEMILILLR